MNIHMRAAIILLALTILIGAFTVPAMADSGSILSGIGFVNASGLNLRQQPDISSPVISTAYSKECVVVLGQEGDWYHVIYNLQEGYMNAAYLSVSEIENAELGYGKVTGSSVNLRSGPGTEYNRVGTASLGQQCYILGLNRGWFKVICNDQICYIRSDYLELTEIPYENRSSSNSPKYFRGGVSIGTVPSAGTQSSSVTASGAGTGSATGAQILEKAKQYLGTPYVYGGASPSGFDCSGFVYYVLGTFGISADRTPAGQYNMGTYVDKSNLQPGDIVFFAGTGGSGITHVGIYAGGGQFIHSPNSRSTVSFADLTSGYWAEHYYGARRVA